MPEHTIPEALIEQIRDGRAALVVGAGLGVPSWKHLLERLTKALEARGREGDDAATKDLDKLLHKGSLVRAIGFLARALGQEACDKIVAETWQAPAERPPIAKAIAQLPFRHIWTTFPGDILEHALTAESPLDWPPPKVVTYQDLGELSLRRRTLVKMLGNFDSFVVAPGSVRRVLSGAVDLRDYARELYVEGTLVFVGFRYGDPDLSALLDRVFGMFEPPRGTHYMLGAGLGPVAIDELMSDHRIEVVHLDGKGGDEVAERSVLDWLEALGAACSAAGLSLVQSRPEADDVEGWVALLGDATEAAAAQDALDGIERRAREDGRHDTLVEVILGKIDHSGLLADDHAVRAQLLRELAAVYEDGLGDLPRAFAAITTALHVAPADTATAEHAERLAAATGNWGDLVTEASEIATAATDPVLASAWWARLGTWYATRLDRPDYALPSLRRALELDPGNGAAHRGLAEALRRQHKWSELADVVRAHAAIEPQVAAKVELLIGLGDLYETQLAQTAKAIEAYEQAVDLDDANADGLAALERLYRKGERWANLAKVLDRRAEVSDAAGDPARAAQIRRELATLRADKLGDLEGAIARYESAVTANSTDAEALKALVDLYDKTGRTDDYLTTLERFAQVATSGDKAPTLRKLASELEDRDSARAATAYNQLLAIEPHADDAYRGLERVLEHDSNWFELVAAYRRHLANAKTAAQRLELFAASAKINARELSQPAQAIDDLLSALAIDDSYRPALIALPRLYLETGVPARAVEILTRHAALEGDAAAPLYAEAGTIAADKLGDPELAHRQFDKALALDDRNLVALTGLAAVHQSRAAWSSAVELLLRAEGAAQNRLERVSLLWDAGQIIETRLDDPARALELYERLLKLDPDHIGAGERAAERLVATARWDDALPVLEMLARSAEGLDPRERGRRQAALGKAYEVLHRTEKAARHYKLAVEADPDSREAALGLAAMLMTEAKTHDAAQPGSAAEEWKEVDRRYREILSRHRSGLAETESAEIWYRLGVIARAMGDDKKAEGALRRALEKSPLHEATLQQLVELAGARDEWRTVAEAKRAQVRANAKANGSVVLRAKLHEEIGDLEHDRLRDTSAAVAAYQDGLLLVPSSHALMHKLLEALIEQRQWRRAVDTLEKLAAHEASPDRRARFHYTAGVIARDEMRDGELAATKLTAALDDAPHTPKAFEALDELLTERKDWKNLARAYRKQLKRVSDETSAERVLELWTRLGDICLDHLGDLAAAIEAFQVAAELAPDDIARREQLADLYIEAGEPRRADAIAELQFLLAHTPDRVELYKELAQLYRAGGELDKAWCVAQALVFLGAASDEEMAFYSAHRPAQFQPAPRRLTDELWQKSIIHPREDRHVGAIFASTLGALAGPSAQPAAAYGLSAETRTDLDRDVRPVSRMVKYVGSVLSIEPAPMVWLQDDGDGLRVANTISAGKLVPSLLVGAPQVGKQDERELAFEVGKRMAYLRPERFVTLALGTLPKLESAFAAAILAGGAQVTGHDGRAYEGDSSPDTRALATALKTSVPGPLLEQVGELSAGLSGRVGNGLIAAWRAATDLTANRVGFILSNDLETAARAIATEGTTLSPMPVKERLRDLLAYSVSEPYFAVRRFLGLSAGAASA